MQLFIEKPKGVSISENTRKRLIKKYGAGSVITTYIKDKQWQMPEKKLSVQSILTMEEVFGVENESVICFYSGFVSGIKRCWFYDSDENSGAWSIYFPGKLNGFDVNFNNSMKYKFSYSDDTPESFFYDLFLKPVSNLSKIRILRNLITEDNSESTLIANGRIVRLWSNCYEVDGVSFSNLDHENDLNSKELDIISLSLTAYQFIKGIITNPKETQASFLKLPHRELKQQAHEAGLGDFLKSYDLTVD